MTGAANDNNRGVKNKLMTGGCKISREVETPQYQRIDID